MKIGLCIVLGALVATLLCAAFVVWKMAAAVVFVTAVVSGLFYLYFKAI